MKAAIRETRDRLAAQLTQTADHVHLLFTTPSSVKTEAPVGGVVAGAIKSDRRRRPHQARLDRREENGPPAPSSDRRSDCRHRGAARGEDTTSLTRRFEHRRNERYGEEG